jgi:hypothetical protein
VRIFAVVDKSSPAKTSHSKEPPSLSLILKVTPHLPPPVLRRASLFTIAKSKKVTVPYIVKRAITAGDEALLLGETDSQE